MKALVIDDSRLARNELKRLLADFENIVVIGEAANATEAIEKIEEFKPDVIFLDIQMPGKDGFELLETLDFVPHTIFTTAYNEYAIKAFQYNAMDYLMKPVDKNLLSAAISKVATKIISEKNIENEDKMTIDDQVFVKDGEKCWFVMLKDVRLFEVDGNYTKIYFEDQKPMIPRTLNYLETRLDPKTFFRANRQQIVNLKWVERIEPWFSGSIRIYLKGNVEVDVSRRQSQRFKELMSF
ncbi:MAG: LytTR family transcriptional regulator DNA-binding domain-containing protein [Cyclobacteriaceae bacterium]|nr:LytTR family transcriptional regulator DNA-binding domain-containing protein [Cyclobacteriaceae bacterium]